MRDSGQVLGMYSITISPVTRREQIGSAAWPSHARGAVTGPSGRVGPASKPGCVWWGQQTKNKNI